MNRNHLLYVATALSLIGGLVWWWPPSAARLENSRMHSWQIYDDRGRLLREVLSDDEGRGIRVPLAEMGGEVAAAIIAIEDKRFYHHPGIDPLALLRAAWLNFCAGRIVSGGSTLTLQLARQMYQLPRRWYAKPVAAMLAMRLELWLSKAEILEQYLNRAPFGNQLFGIEAASRIYFARPARQLSLAEAALLAGLPQSPSRFNPYTNMERALRRQRQVLAAMRRDGVITAEQYQQALQQPVRLAPRQRTFAAPHFCQMVLQAARGGGVASREIHTTLNSALQFRVEELVDGHVRQLARHHLSNAAVLVVENASGAVKAWVGSHDFNDEIHQGQVDGVRSLRQPGSAVKPFTYALALEHGFTAASILADIETHAETEGGDLAVHNYDEKYHGPVRLRTALACSYNVATVRLLEALGTDLLLERLRRLGLTSLQKPASFYGLGLTLGNGEVTLLELTNAYRTLANGGLRRPLQFITSQESGAEAAEEERGEQLINRAAAFIIADILSDPHARAPAFGLGGPLRLPFPCAAKTGTTKDFRDNWTVGFTNRYTVGVWVGNFDGTPMERISGITGAAPLFRDVMLELHPDFATAPPAVPPGLLQAPICPVSGLRPGADCPGSTLEWFISGSEPRSACQVHRRLVIDRRSGRLAGPATPAGEREERLFELWPPAFRAWMAANRLPLPPEEGAPPPLPRLAIAFPDDGDILKIDPVLRREYQTIQLEVVVPEGIREVEWFVNEQSLGRVGRPFHRRWMLQPGNHLFRVQAEAGGAGRLSDSVRVQIL